LAGYDVVVVGASAGGVEALGTLMGGLPADFPAAVLVVLHVMAGGRSMLPQILTRSGPLPAVTAADGEAVVRSRIYVAPPDHHMMLDDGTLQLNRGPRENGHRPAIDPLFRSAARAYGPRVIGVILSGLLDDGAAGLRVVKEQGGATVVQEPSDALFSAMPVAAIAATDVDRLAPAEMIPQVLAELIRCPLPAPEPGPLAEADLVEQDPGGLALVDGLPTPLSCPACGGAMWETVEGPVVRFTCQVGHAFSTESMLREQGSAVEQAMWGALRSLEERAELLRGIARRQSRGSRVRFEERAADVEAQARQIRAVLVDRGVDEWDTTEPEVPGASGG
jgi:two-component system chemotaxis response regulator CheB